MLDELLQQLDRFCQEEIAPIVNQDEKDARFRLEIFQKLGEFGFTGMTSDESFGGLGLDHQYYAHALSKLAEYSVSYAVTLSVSSMIQAILLEFANEQQKQTYLPKLVSGQEIGAFALTESSSGSDAGSLKLKAQKVEGGYQLNGTKMFTTSGGIAKTYIVMARTGAEGSKGISALIVREGTPGFSYGKLEEKMGWKISPTRELIFENCFIPDNNLLSDEGDGFKIALSALDKGRIGIAAIAVGLARVALNESLKYSLERQQFGSSLFEFQGLQFMLADLATEIEASWQLTLKAAQSMNQGKVDTLIASMAKLKATDTAMKVTTDAVQIFGGVGYTTEYPVERFMRDAKGLQIVEGANQIQRLVIARELKKRLQA